MEESLEKGQALLIIVLIMVVVVTVGLSIASRSITNVRTSTEEENSKRAFSAAQSGIEKSLECITPTPGDPSPPPCVPVSISFPDNLTSVNATSSATSGTVYVVNNGIKVAKDQSIDVWLVPLNPDGTPNFAGPSPNWLTDGRNSKFNVYWGSSGEACSNDPTLNYMAALEILVYTATDGDITKFPTLNRYVAEPCNGSITVVNRGNSNFFTGSSGLSVVTSSFSASGKTYAYGLSTSSIINIANKQGILIRITPLYASTQIALCSGETNSCNGIPFPSQGNVITSTGISGGTQRAITHFQNYTCPAEFCQYSFFQH